MKYRTFGRTGWKVSEIGFGAWAIGGKGWGPQKDEESLAALRRALDIGVTFIDTAQGYGDGHSEQLIGSVLAERGVRVGRGPVRVLTKIPPMPGSWPASPYDTGAQRYPESYLRERVERSLRDLKAETLDVVLLHLWSRSWNRDPEPLHTLRALQKEGKLLALGISNSEFDENAVNDPIRAGLLDAVETVYNIFDQNPAGELLPTAQEHNVAVVARSPLDEGALTGKMTADTVFPEGDVRRNYFRGDRMKKTTDRIEAIRRDLETASGGKEKDLASAALRFVLRSPAVSTTIPGMRSVRQAEQNAAVSDQPPLSDELYEALKKHFWYRVFWLD
jgi:aryl-alcohol dehydrogenase-like predicted oxidoreductase